MDNILLMLLFIAMIGLAIIWMILYVHCRGSKKVKPTKKSKTIVLDIP